MKRLKLIFSLSLIALLVLTSCDSVEEAQLTADEFFTAFNMQDESKMEFLLDQTAVIDAGLKDDFYDVFEQHWQYFGKVKNYDKYGFSTNSTDGNTIVSLKFKCETEKGATVYEHLKFIKRGDYYKIIQFDFNIDKMQIE